MDSIKCRTLITVLETGNIHKAASILGYSPSGISKMMSSLEQELGIELLSRGKRGVQATEACTQLLPAFTRLAIAGEALNESVENILGMKEGNLNIGIAYPYYFPPLLEAINFFRNAHPGITFRIKEANSTPLANMLSNGEIDMAIMSYREGDFHWNELTQDKLVAVLPKKHPFAEEKVFPLKEFENEPNIEIGPNEDADNQRAFNAFGIKPNTRCSVSDDRISRKLVESGLGISLTNNLIIRDITEDVVVKPIDPEVIVSIGFACINPQISTPAAQKFYDMALIQLKNYK